MPNWGQFILSAEKEFRTVGNQTLSAAGRAEEQLLGAYQRYGQTQAFRSLNEASGRLESEEAILARAFSRSAGAVDNLITETGESLNLAEIIAVARENPEAAPEIISAGLIALGLYGVYKLEKAGGSLRPKVNAQPSPPSSAGHPNTPDAPAPFKTPGYVFSDPRLRGNR